MISARSPWTTSCRMHSSAPCATSVTSAACLNQSIKAQALDQAADVGLVDAAAQVAQVLDDLRPAEAGIEGELARQVADQLLDLGGLCPAIQPADGGAPAIRVQQAHQRAHGGSLAC